ncbi:hypothetical protein QR680_003071 [Steinernema hermaphroditum]|uniref:DUF19 domain-containing protein n=1 Tax=Steinernema hermaphroditum TaxID=289476 RepID=A0AA39H5A1_9BILA|nr:hypothetical protein QR680_003071 [Steinernema hermaphroditum]
MYINALALVLAFAAVAFGDLKLHDPQGLQVFEQTGEALPRLYGNHQGAAGICLSDRRRYCQVAFNNELGILSNADWNSPQQLLYDINKKYKQGLDQGLLPLCTARTHLYQCLGTSYDVCMDRLGFVREGKTLANATMYTQIFKQLAFECTGGSIQSTQHWDCIESVRLSSTYSASVQTCTNQFNDAIAKSHGNQTVFCKEAGVLAMCLALNFQIPCGRDTAWWECERVRAAFQVDGYCPQLSCVHSAVPHIDGHHSYGSRAELVMKEFGTESAAARIYREVVDNAYAKLKRK